MKLDRVYPPVVHVGGEVSLTCKGNFPTWPAEIFCDRADVNLTCENDKGKLKVVVDSKAGPGVAWIRMYDPKGASGLVPLIVSPIVAVSEKEPNNKNSEAPKLEMPTVVCGELAKSGDIDAYRVTLKSGQQLVASVTANQVLRSPIDTVLQIADVDGNVLAQSEDVRGLDPQILFTADRSEDVLVRIFGFPATPNSTIGFAGGSAYAYTIDITTDAFLDHALEDSDGEQHVFGFKIDKSASTHRVGSTEISPPTVYADNSLGWSWLSQPSETSQPRCRQRGWHRLAARCDQWPHQSTTTVARVSVGDGEG